MIAHSLFHATGKAHCKTPWATMPGTDRVRTCPDCAARVYNLEGLSEEAIPDVLSEHEQAPMEQLRLSRRKDGTFTSSTGRCTVLAVPVSYLSDWRASVRTVVLVLKNSPFILAAMILLHLMPLHQVMAVPIMLLAVMINCRLIRACSAELDGESWKPNSSLDYSRYGAALVNHLIFSFAQGVGYILFVIPGLLVAICGCLSLPAVVLDKVGPLEAFNESLALTRRRSGLVARYMAIPSLFFIIPAAFPFVIWPILAVVGMPHASWFSGYLVWISLGLMGMSAVLSSLAGFVFIPLQVKLYRRLMAEQAKKTALLPAAPQDPVERW